MAEESRLTLAPLTPLSSSLSFTRLYDLELWCEHVVLPPRQLLNRVVALIGVEGSGFGAVREQLVLAVHRAAAGFKFSG